MRKFDILCESYDANKTMKKVRTIRYPKQIELSEEFKAALTAEVERMNIVNEDTQDPNIRNFGEKFLKALKFELAAINEACSRRRKKRKKMMEEAKKKDKPMQPERGAEFARPGGKSGAHKVKSKDHPRKSKYPDKDVKDY